MNNKKSGKKQARGIDYLNQITLEINQVTGSEYCFIGSYNKENKTIKCISFRKEKALIDNIEFDITNTLCNKMLNKGLQFYPESVQKHFPSDPLFTKLNIEGCYGVPLFSLDGNTLIGVLFLLFTKKIEQAEKTEGFITQLTPRIELELDRLLLSKKLKNSHKKLTKQNIELNKIKTLMQDANQLAKAGTWEIDIKTKKVYWDDAAKKVFESPPDYEPNVLTAINLYASESSRITIANAVKKAMENGIGYDLVANIVTFNKNKKIIRTVGKPVMENGKCVRLYGFLRDITKEVKQDDKIKKQNTELNKTKELMLRANKLAKTGTWELNLETKTAFWDEVSKEILETPTGFLDNAIAGINFYADEENRKKAEEVVEKAVKTGIGFDIIIDVITYKKKKKKIRSLGKPVMENGKCIQIYGVLQDVTKQVLQKEKIKESEVTFKGLFNNTENLILIFNLDGILIDVNETVINRYHYPKEYFIGKGLEIFESHNGLNDLLELQENFKKTSKGNILNFEWWAKNKKGEIIPNEVTVKRGVYFGQKALIVVAKDITARKTAEKQLIATEKKYRNIFNLVLDIIFRTDENRKIVAVTPSVLDVLGYHPSEVLGKRLVDLFDVQHYVDKINNQEIEGNITKEGDVTRRALNYPIELTHRNGKKLTLEINSTHFFDNDNNFLGAEGVARDITKRLQTEKLLEEERKEVLKAQYEGEEREKNRISIDLHDGLGQVLTAAKFNLKAIENQKNIDPYTKERIKDVKTLIYEAANETQRISKSLLPRILEDFGLEKAIEKMLIDIKNTFQIKTSFSVNSQIKINKEDEKMIYRIIQESINNSIKHSNASVIEVCFDIIDKKNIFTISDNGKGFDSSLKTDGFGLSNLKQRAYSINGKLNIISQLGKGTKITLKTEINE